MAKRVKIKAWARVWDDGVVTGLYENRPFVIPGSRVVPVLVTELPAPRARGKGKKKGGKK